MQKQLFFDDNKFFSKENVVRDYGCPELVGEYIDDVVSTDFCTGLVFPIDDGKYRLLYFGHSTEFKGHKLFSAISEDGITFKPEPLFDISKNKEKQFSHEVLDIKGSEIAAIYEDAHTEKANERYKLLLSRVAHGEIKVIDDIYVSPDLVHWEKLEGASWGDGTEPLASVFYNEHQKVHTIIERSFWGIRSAGYKETKDFINYTEFRHCLNVDSLDEDLAEIYGMQAFEYDGIYIGIPHMYRGFGSGLYTKYSSGIIDTQLAYSFDGRYWHRSLRKPFISGVNGSTDKKYPLVWVNSMARINGDIYLYASVSEKEHGPAFSAPGTGKILVFRLREDGFVLLKTADASKESLVATREKIWHGGELRVNLRAQYATLAVYTTQSQDEELNILGIASPLEGYGHEDCVAFSGDSTDWVPEYKNGKRISDLAGKTIVFEIKFENGEIYSLGGNYTDAFNVEAAIYRKHGVLRR
jgi:hypothetical protein